MSESAAPAEPAFSGEKIWAGAYLAAALAFIGSVITYLVTRNDLFFTLGGIAGGVLLVIRWRFRMDEAQRDPVKAKALALGIQFRKLAFAAPFIFVVLMAFGAFRAWYRNRSLSTELGESALVSAAVLASLALLIVLGRAAVRVFFKI